jgi:hypothetical protein
VEGLEREFRSFNAAVHSENTLSDSLKAHGATIGLKTRGIPSAPGLPNYGSSVAGFPRSSLRAATVESDVSTLKWEHDEFRSTLTAPSVENIEQRKQFEKAMALQHHWPEEA